MGDAIDCIMGEGQVDFAVIRSILLPRRSDGSGDRSRPVDHEYLQ